MADREPLVEGGQYVPFEKRCFQSTIYAIKITLLILGTYGLMVAMFKLCLVIQTFKDNSVASTYETGGGILMGLFIFEVICWGIAWCWGAKKRDSLRRAIVEKQLQQIRAQQKQQQQRDIEEQRKMIEQRKKLR